MSDKPKELFGWDPEFHREFFARRGRPVVDNPPLGQPVFHEEELETLAKAAEVLKKEAQRIAEEKRGISAYNFACGRFDEAQEEYQRQCQIEYQTLVNEYFKNG